MKEETKGKVTFGSWGVVIGAVIIMIIGFAWGGWTTASTTKTMTEEAVLASQVAICVAQFSSNPNYEATLKEFEKVNSVCSSDFEVTDGLFGF